MLLLPWLPLLLLLPGEVSLGGDGGGASTPEVPRWPGARELPWPASSADLWRFAAGSPTRVPSPRCNLRRPASPDDAPELLWAWLGPLVAGYQPRPACPW
jgi:hypothetical protein